MPKSLHPYYLKQMGIESWILRKQATNTIKLMVVAEALDSNKKASSLFNKMLNSINLSLDDVCLKSTLSNQLLQDIISDPPQLLLVVGSAATQFLLNDSRPTNTLRGKIHSCHNTSLVVSYHPVDLLQCPSDKKSAWQDLLCIQQILAS